MQNMLQVNYGEMRSVEYVCAFSFREYNKRKKGKNEKEREREREVRVEQGRGRIRLRREVAY